MYKFGDFLQLFNNTQIFSTLPLSIRDLLYSPRILNNKKEHNSMETDKTVFIKF